MNDFDNNVERVIADERNESDPCEKLTPGCCIKHNDEDSEGSCETW